MSEFNNYVNCAKLCLKVVSAYYQPVKAVVARSWAIAGLVGPKTLYIIYKVFGLACSFTPTLQTRDDHGCSYWWMRSDSGRQCSNSQITAAFYKRDPKFATFCTDQSAPNKTNNGALAKRHIARSCRCKLISQVGSHCRTCQVQTWSYRGAERTVLRLVRSTIFG